MICTSHIKTGPLRMLMQARTRPEEVWNDKYKSYQDRTARNVRCNALTKPGMISASHIRTEPPGMFVASPNKTRKRSGMLGTSLIKTEPPRMIGASSNKTRKTTGMISTSLIETGPPGMMGASPNKTRKRSGMINTSLV